MATGKSHSCATFLAKVGLLMYGSQRCSWMAQRHTSSVQPHRKYCYLRTDRSVMWTDNKDDCKPSDYILLKDPVQVFDYGCCVHSTPLSWPFFCMKHKIMWPVLHSYSLIQLATEDRYHGKLACIFLIRTVHPSAFQFLQLPIWIIYILPMQSLSLFPLKVNVCVGELLIDHLMHAQPELSGQIFVQHSTPRAARTPQLFSYSRSHTCLIMSIVTLTRQ